MGGAGSCPKTSLAHEDWIAARCTVSWYWFVYSSWSGMYYFVCLARCGHWGNGAWKVWGLDPSPTLFAGPSLSKHLGGQGLVVVMVTRRARLNCFWLHHSFRHLPQAHLLLMSLIIFSPAMKGEIRGKGSRILQLYSFRSDWQLFLHNFHDTCTF